METTWISTYQFNKVERKLYKFRFLGIDYFPDVNYYFFVHELY